MSKRTTQLDSMPSPTRNISSAVGIEARTIDYVPVQDRHGKVWQQAPFWFLGNFQPLTLSLGFLGPAFGLDFVSSVITGVIGVAFGTLFMAFHASQGPHLGLPQLVQSRAQFGFRGVIPILVVAVITFVGVSIVNLLIIGGGLSAIYGWNGYLAAAVAAVASTVVAIFGHDWLHKIFRVLLYISLPLYAILTIAVFVDPSTLGKGSAQLDLGFNWPGCLAFFSITAAWNIGYALYVSDYTRYLPPATSPGAVISSTFTGAAGSAIWLLILGAWIASKIKVVDPLSTILAAGNGVFPGFGHVLVFLAVVTLAAVMALNAYSGSLSLLTGQDAVRTATPSVRSRVLVTLIIAVVTLGIAFALWNSALALLSTLTLVTLFLLVPWSAINLVDFFIVRKGKYSTADLFDLSGIYGHWSWRGLTAYGIGLLVSLPFASWGFFTGPVAKALGGTDFAFVPGLLVSGTLYFFFSRSINQGAEAEAIARSERELGPR